jgi:phospholipid/cholesterol/gamma-HCH transport system substrate-binding protein
METRVRYIVVGLFAVVVGLTALFLSLWLQGGGNIRGRRDVEIRFEGPAPGLQAGVAVTFDGLHVGEVTGVAFDPEDPNSVEARISIDAATPLSATTQVSLETQGLLGSVYVSLYGGTANQKLVAPPGQSMPTLVAPAATSLTQDAHRTLVQIQTLLSDNAKPLHDLVSNLQTFSGTLAGNSDRIDKILAGLEQMTGAGEKPPPPETYDLAAPSLGDVLADVPEAQLVIDNPKSVVTLATQRFLDEKPDGRLTLQTAQWSDAIPQLVQEKILQTFENAHYRFVSLPSDAASADYHLLLNIRRFQILETDGLTAEVELDAQLMDHDGKIVAARLIDQKTATTASDGSAAAQAMTQAFAAAAADLLAWYGQTVGQAQH